LYNAERREKYFLASLPSGLCEQKVHQGAGSWASGTTPLRRQATGYRSLERVFYHPLKLIKKCSAKCPTKSTMTFMEWQRFCRLSIAIPAELSIISLLVFLKARFPYLSISLWFSHQFFTAKGEDPLTNGVYKYQSWLGLYCRVDAVFKWAWA
jgi:hypothetical protein